MVLLAAGWEPSCQRFSKKWSVLRMLFDWLIYVKAVMIHSESIACLRTLCHRVTSNDNRESVFPTSAALAFGLFKDSSRQSFGMNNSKTGRCWWESDWRYYRPNEEKNSCFSYHMKTWRQIWQLVWLLTGSQFFFLTWNGLKRIFLKVKKWMHLNCAYQFFTSTENFLYFSHFCQQGVVQRGKRAWFWISKWKRGVGCLIRSNFHRKRF